MNISARNAFKGTIVSVQRGLSVQRGSAVMNAIG